MEIKITNPSSKGVTGLPPINYIASGFSVTLEIGNEEEKKEIERKAKKAGLKVTELSSSAEKSTEKKEETVDLITVTDDMIQGAESAKELDKLLNESVYKVSNNKKKAINKKIKSLEEAK